MNSLHGVELTFKEIERTFFEIGCEVARTLMQQFMETTDNELAKSRNKSELRHKGNRTTAIKTLMGEVPMKRVLYKRVRDDGSAEYVFLLDEVLGLDTIGKISPNLTEKILGNICETGYREVSKTVSELTNQTISHQAVWNVVQSVGEKQIEAEKQLVEKFKANKLSGTKEVPILFEEADGVWLSMQGKSRKGCSRGRKELKVGVVYEGWEKRYSGSKEYRTVEKTLFAGYMKPEEFKNVRDAEVARKYNVDEIKLRVLNGDGAAWIRNGHDLETDIFQLDPYHIAKYVVRNIADKKDRRQIMKWLKAGEFDKFFARIHELKYECGGVETEVKKLTVLEDYIRNNIEGVLSYKARPGIEIPEPPEGLEYRNMGTMERNINIFADRMKGGKSWSEAGATNLAKIIALKAGKGFNDKIAVLVLGQLSERLTERFEETIRRVNKSMGKAKRESVYPVQKGQIPFSNAKVTNGRKAIRAMFDLKPFTEMVYR
jgi:hypothetical protein